ncbi:MAG: hypothetical protein P8Y35_00675 [Sulfurovaceae bacterium]
MCKVYVAIILLSSLLVANFITVQDENGTLKKKDIAHQGTKKMNVSIKMKKSTPFKPSIESCR